MIQPGGVSGLSTLAVSKNILKQLVWGKAFGGVFTKALTVSPRRYPKKET